MVLARGCHDLSAVLHRSSVRPPVALVALFAIATLVATGCSGGSGKKAQADKTSGTTAPNVKTAALKAASTVDVESAGAATTLDGPTKTALVAAATAYVQNASLAPLSTGRLGADYATLFDPGVRAPATTTDVRALTDESVGKVDNYTETVTPVQLSALADSSGVLLYAATNFGEQVNAKTAAGPVTIKRTIELTLAPGADKHWTVTAYRVVAARSTPAGTTTTTASAGGKP